MSGAADFATLTMACLPSDATSARCGFSLTSGAINVVIHRNAQDTTASCTSSKHRSTQGTSTSSHDARPTTLPTPAMCLKNSHRNCGDGEFKHVINSGMRKLFASSLPKNSASCGEFTKSTSYIAFSATGLLPLRCSGVSMLRITLRTVFRMTSISSSKLMGLPPTPPLATARCKNSTLKRASSAKTSPRAILTNVSESLAALLKIGQMYSRNNPNSLCGTSLTAVKMSEIARNASARTIAAASCSELAQNGNINCSTHSSVAMTLSLRNSFNARTRALNSVAPRIAEHTCAATRCTPGHFTRDFIAIATASSVVDARSMASIPLSTRTMVASKSSSSALMASIFPFASKCRNCALNSCTRSKYDGNNRER
mmetsp:Transcript_5331/g.19464  ORF Transcript_5331/g.19464 Transcript_5331/m.19464 type:complete len:371 (-) Transcript_5331:1015-2127(-)